MNMEISEINPEGKIEEIPYEGDQSPDFDEKLKNKPHVDALQDNLSEITKDQILLAEWQVPCHCVLLKSESGEYQLLHVKPNKFSGSLLTYEQDEALKDFGKKNSEAIIAKGKRSWFNPNDEKEIERAGVMPKKVISVETSQWWRFLFDPETNEVWIDRKVEKILTKYSGF